MADGVKCVQTGQKDEVALEGNDLELVRKVYREFDTNVDEDGI